jgi:phenol 2-monooxygenase
MDIVPKTDFPDTRKVCVIHSAAGSIMIVPREQNLVRFYVQLGVVGTNLATSMDQKSVSFEKIMGSAKAILAPFTLESGHCDWWSAYRVGQRVADQFSKHNRVFLAGDAVRKITRLSRISFSDS